jgi:hypothetical protein
MKRCEMKKTGNYLLDSGALQKSKSHGRLAGHF